MIKQNRQTLRTFIHSVSVAAVVALAMLFSGHGRWAAGFLIGAGLSLFSLYSLKVCIPALFRPGAPRYSSALMQVLLLFKLPLYAVSLYLATRLGTEASFAAFGGCALVPCVVSAEGIYRAVLEANPRWRRDAAMREQSTELPAAEDLSLPAPAPNAGPREMANLPSQARSVRKGAA